jgi:uncharacterized low-complexity protein
LNWDTRKNDLATLPLQGESRMNKHKTNPLVTAIGSAFVAATALSAVALSSSTFAAENPFQADQLRSGYNLAAGHAEGKCGEGKCGESKAKAHSEGKCGEGKCGEGKAKSEGKCGEGKCGEGKAKAHSEGKCGEGKIGEGSCGEDKAKAEGKCGEDKCGGAA